VEVVALLSQGRTAAAQCGLFTHKSVPVIFEPPCIFRKSNRLSNNFPFFFVLNVPVTRYHHIDFAWFSMSLLLFADICVANTNL